ncbi:hypothetical protein [Paraburkholderia sp. SIMBA_054]|uniref:hypothetical protein n=1 Tax=Paraburkholderia sp. SIMBA_054 TaxID=3085795 RepID=UPI00397A262C
MISFILRCLFSFALLSSLPYSTSHSHVDVLDPHPCLSLIGNSQSQADGACIYRDVSLQGDVMARRYWIGGADNVQVEARDAQVISGSNNQGGWTWKTYLLLLGAFIPWILSLLVSAMGLLERTGFADGRKRANVG